MIYQLCYDLLQQGTYAASSTRIGKLLGITAHTVRKDLNCLGDIGNTGSGYNLIKLKQHLSETLGFDQRRKACIVGLGRLGSALLSYDHFTPDGFTVAAGFDSNINRIETLHSTVPTYPAYEMTDVVQREGISLAMLTVPACAAQDATDLLIGAGIQGIVNFAPVVIKSTRPYVAIRNINVVNELRILSSLLTLNTDNHSIN